MSTTTTQPTETTLLEAAQNFASDILHGQITTVGQIDDAVMQMVAAAKREVGYQLTDTPTGPQVEYREAHASFLAALDDIRELAETRDLRAIEALADMTAAAMRQADRAYVDLQEHNTARLSPEHMEAHLTEDVVGTGPHVTERFMHKQTTKGWRLDESSLTIDWNGHKPNRELRARLLLDSFAAGEAEAERRNEPTADVESTAVAS